MKAGQDRLIQEVKNEVQCSQEELKKEMKAVY